MMELKRTVSRREALKGLEYVAMTLKAGAEFISFRDTVMALALFVVVAKGAEEILPFLPSSQVEPAQEEALPAVIDPVLARWGEHDIRLADARLAARRQNVEGADELPSVALLENGVVASIIAETALAERAHDAGLANRPDIRAELQAAQREILADHWLSHQLEQVITEQVLQSAYDSEVSSATSQDVVELRRILVSSEDEARQIKLKIDRGARFANMAARLSLDMETRSDGGRLGAVTTSSLPPVIAAAVAQLPVGEVSSPIKAETGWYLLMVDVRRQLALPGFEEMAEPLRRELESVHVANLVEAATQSHPVIIEDRDPGDGELILPTAVALTARW